MKLIQSNNNPNFIIRYWLVLVPILTTLLANILFINSGFNNFRLPLILITSLIWAVIFGADLVFKTDINKPDKDLKKFSNWILIAGAGVHFSLVLSFLFNLSSFKILRIVNLGDFVSLMVLILMTGLSLGLGISAIAHELIHRNVKWQKKLGTAMLFVIGYAHNSVEHIQAHHRLVATSIDNSTAKLNQGFWNYFWNNNIIGEYVEAFKIETERFTKKNLPPYSFQNLVIRYAFLYFWFLVFVLVICGQVAFFGFLLTVLIAKIFHAAIVYSQHYALTRDVTDKIDCCHSWQTNSLVTEYLVLGFGNHGEHHVKVTKTYLEINNVDNSPTLPFGYFACSLLALFPYSWFQKINPILKNFQKDLN